MPYGYVVNPGWSGTWFAQAWGYADKTEAIADNFSRLKGYQPMMEDGFDWANMTSSTFANLTQPTRVPNKEIRIWQGSADTNVPLALNQKLVELLRKNNVPATLRVISGATHSASSGGSEIVRNEAVNWFKRFVN